MASKRISKSAIDWAKMSRLVPEHEKQFFQSFKARSDAYLQRVLSYPEKPPQIDWSYYRSRVPVAGLVDKFEKEYQSLQVPFPKDTKSSEIAAQEKDAMQQAEVFCKESVQRIENYKKEMAYYEALIPFDQWTLEDHADVFPNEAFNPRERPVFWPQNEPDDMIHESGDVAKH